MVFFVSNSLLLLKEKQLSVDKFSLLSMTIRFSVSGACHCGVSLDRQRGCVYVCGSRMLDLSCCDGER